jgi:hypothetical protein
MSKFFQHLDLPILDNFFIQEAFKSEFVLVNTPSSLIRSHSSFMVNNFSKMISSSLGKVGTSYHKQLPHSLYDWHIDNNRSCAILWVIQTNPQAKTFYREAVSDTTLMYNITEVDYTLCKPTLLNTKYEHCVINNSDEDRITLNMSIFDTPYEKALEFFQNLKINSYSQI